MRNPLHFKCRASAAGKIMAGRMGLTDKQELRLAELIERSIKGPILTANMETELSTLVQTKLNANTPDALPETCKTYLKEWYSGDYEEIHSKYIEKGNAVEADNIDFAAQVLGYGIAAKNTVQFSDETSTGEPDSILHDAILEVKSAWDIKSLHDKLSGVDFDNVCQVRIYMKQTNKDKAIIFHGLQDTPAEIAGTNEDVSFTHLPDEERWTGYIIHRDKAWEAEFDARVKLCRQWLVQYDEFVKRRLGRLVAV